MKALIKIIIGALIIVASLNATRAAFAEYQFTDAVHEGLLFEPRASDEEIIDMVVKVAAQQDIPITTADVAVRRVGQEIHVDATYTTEVVLVPGVFSKEWTFTPTTSIRQLDGVGR